MQRELFVASRAEVRCAQASAFLRALPANERALVVAPSLSAATHVCRAALGRGDVRFGWFKRTLGMLARELAVPALAERGLASVHGLGREALCARVAHELVQAGQLVRYGGVADRPGFVRALAATLSELRMANVSAEAVLACDADLGRLLSRYEAELAGAGLVDEAGVYRLATAAAATLATPSLGVPLLLLDVALWHGCESEFVAALCARAPAFLVTAIAGDERTRSELARVLSGARETVQRNELHSDLDRLRERLFTTDSALVPEDSGHEEARVELMSSPGEGREAVEVVRHVLAAAARGVRFDRMAVVLRATRTYRSVVEEAFARAEVPAHFADGVERPHPEGRAFLALLECAREGLSARAFAEYLSLGVMVREDDEAGESAFIASPHKWERLLVDAAVMHGRARWERRLAGLTRALEEEKALLEDDDPRRDKLKKDLEQLQGLVTYALPILDALTGLPVLGTWGEWLAELTALARRALAQPESVCEILAELTPLSPLGPVALPEVIRVLSRRLPARITRSEGPSAGKVLVGSADDVRGQHFDVVFVLGLAEKLFPPRLSEDPLLTDAQRRTLSPRLACVDDLARRERGYLHTAISAANGRIVLSFPRFDTVHARPRVPSFYGLEVLRAVDGVLPAFDELSRRAHPGAAARMGFPAPERAEQAIDAAEYDLAVLGVLLHARGEAQRGAAAYLLHENAHLARALRFRARRWMLGKFSPADGFVVTSDALRAQLSAESLKVRNYSATALASMSSCPYRFFLHAMMRVAPRETVSAQDELDARQRGVMFHAVLRRTLSELRTRGLLPVTRATLSTAQGVLAAAFELDSEAARESYAPAIEGVFRDALRSARRDLDEWLVRLAEETAFIPAYFELGFGVSARADLDADSRNDGVMLDNGMRFSGVIDLVERGRDDAGRPLLRATDYKTGAVPQQLGPVVSGGRVLQPLLYALSLEQLFPGEQVQGGRLYFCTADAGFATHGVPLQEHTRVIARELAESIDGLITQGFLPAAPAPGACEFCPYQSVCGPYEELRVSKEKRGDLKRLAQLHHLRNLP